MNSIKGFAFFNKFRRNARFIHGNRFNADGYIRRCQFRSQFEGKYVACINVIQLVSMTAERTADEIKEAMRRRIESIQRRADALKSEANFRGLTVADQPAPEWVTSHPEKVALAAAGKLLADRIAMELFY